jgi:hypothetical protein
MKWFDNWFTKKVHWANNRPQDTDDGPHLVMTGSQTSSPVKNKSRGIAISTRESSELESRGVSFTLYNANGGHVVELRHYDEKSDRMKNSLHVVPHDKDLGEALNHIITYEALKR